MSTCASEREASDFRGKAANTVNYLNRETTLTEDQAERASDALARIRTVLRETRPPPKTGDG